MDLTRLLHTVDLLEIRGNLSGTCESLCYDSRTCGPGSLFVAIPGLKTDGHAHIADALGRGAWVVVHEAPWTPPSGVTAVRVADARRALGRLARNFFGDPSAALTLVAITGTNGKTTVTYLLEAILKAAGYRVGVLGTVNYRYGDKTFAAPNTTPESCELQRLLRQMADAGVTHVVAEVSSHAVDLKRVDEVAFDIGVFTNLSQDHLDYHVTMERYYAAKRRFFTEVLPSGGKGRPCPCVVNADDPWGRRLAGEVTLPVLSFGLTERAGVTAADAQLTLAGITARLRCDQGEFPVRSPLIGRFNLSNLLAAAAAALSLGVPTDAIAAGIAALAQVPGRLERVSRGGEPTVFVDYAHTDDALRRVLETLNDHRRGRIVTVFGCGGDRDRAKRPLMGRAAADLSDLTVVTSDNPRSEDPAAIIVQIEAGIAARGIPKLPPEALKPDRQPRMTSTPSPEAPGTASPRGYTVIPDRAEAIAAAIALAAETDICLIAGKGHEDYQILGDRRIFFDDRLIARRALDARKRPLAEARTGGDTERGGPRLDVAAILAATGGELIAGPPEAVLAGVSTDTRTLSPGALFVALAGEHFNGHDCLGEALARGAGGLLVSRARRDRLPGAPGGIVIIAVDDPLTALGGIAHAWRMRFALPVCAITGSSGKTTTKEMAHAILSQNKRVLATEGNFNNLIGLPLTLLRLDAADEIAVLELGTNRPGEIARLTEIAAPTAGLVTNIGPAHLEGLGSLDAIRREKGDLFGRMDPAGGIAVLNGDDPSRDALKERWPGRTVVFGFDPAHDVFADAPAPAAGGGTRFTLHAGGAAREVTLAAPGRHNVANALAAAALAWAAGTDPDTIAAGLARFRPVAGRMQIFTLASGAHLIDDAYNANPASVAAALQTLAGLRESGAGVAVLGDMLELGEQSENLHAEIGARLVETGVSQVHLTGAFARTTADAAVAAGLARERIVFFTSPEEVVADLKDRLHAGDWILVKGSRRMRLDAVVQAIRETL
ncbi:MAG: UDP-N-acetylmuramoyl-L-alanyl-D-glutamate--2,6-diaminopimelate ligase [Syntrophales bacterium]|nr:UDP-N-acetylmuramoyl-L-alanyl-D-glutamate--2,6-diaminopimelate ligase [Syntrophales bacterium]